MDDDFAPIYGCLIQDSNPVEHRLQCDNCVKIMQDDDPVIVCDNYDFGFNFAFCSQKCFEEFHNVRRYDHVKDIGNREFLDLIDAEEVIMEAKSTDKTEG